MNHALMLGRMVAILALAALAGCATSFQGINVAPPPPGPITTLRSQSVLIRNVIDNRVFEESPAQASTPSLAEDVADVAPSAVKAQAIGRVRDGFGKARGNVLLPEGRTVEALMRDTIANIFRGLGFQVETDEGNLSGGDVTVDVTIDEFWGWVDVNPGGGFTGSGAMYMDGKIVTRLDIKGPLGKESQKSIEATARHRLGVGVTPANWQKLYKLMLEEYANLARKGLADLPQP